MNQMPERMAFYRMLERDMQGNTPQIKEGNYEGDE